MSKDAIKSRQAIESKLQAQIVQWLQGAGYYFFSIPNEAMGRSTVAQMQLIAMGMRPGAADLVVLVPPGVVFLEVKAPDGEQSERQVRFKERVQAMGYRYEVVRSVEDVACIFLHKGD